MVRHPKFAINSQQKVFLTSLRTELNPKKQNSKKNRTFQIIAELLFGVSEFVLNQEIWQSSPFLLAVSAVPANPNTNMSYHFAPMLTQDEFQGKRPVGCPKGSKNKANIETQDQSSSVGRPKRSKNQSNIRIRLPVVRQTDSSALSNPGMYESLCHMRGGSDGSFHYQHSQ